MRIDKVHEWIIPDTVIGISLEDTLQVLIKNISRLSAF